jgi:membrane fusion protein, copper/silver efflux system
MKKAALLIFAATLGLGSYWAGRWHSEGGSAEPAGRKILYWHDPMHPAYKSDKPGIAPDCGMRLEPVYADGGPAAAEPTGEILYYRDPHDPEYRADVPGFNPETGNELEPVYADSGSGLPPGAIQVSAEKQQLIGVRYGEPEWAATDGSVRAAGQVVYDETRIVRVQPKIEGWVEKVFADFTGKLVREGQPLATVYSPEMVATQQEFLLAMKARERLRDSSVGGAPEHTSSLLEAARRRLELWDLTPDQIRRIEETRTPVKAVTVFAPQTGFVTERNAFPNQKVSPDTPLYTIADLSRVWVMAEVYEADAGSIRVGQSAVIRLPYGSRRAWNARVAHIQPAMDTESRTLQVRLETANSGFELKAGMYVDVEFAIPSPRMLTVPTEAVLDSGLQKTVFVALGDGRFEPRQVETGRRLNGRIEILQGLAPDERIVTSGNFLLNSESQLKSAAGGMGPGHQHDQGSPAARPAQPADPGSGVHAHD